MPFRRAAQVAALCAFCTALPGADRAARAQDATLVSLDGTVEVTGTLLGFDGEYYRIDTAYGELTVDGSGVSCDGPGCPDLEHYVAELRISGATTTGQVLLPALVEGFARRENLALERADVGPGFVRYTLSDGPDEARREIARFTIHSTNTDEGFADLLANEADIVMALREIRPDEADNARAAGLGDMRARGRMRVIALDALVPVVAPDNPLREITLPDLARVFAGRVDNWRALGGPDAPIALHLRDRASGLGQATEQRLLDPLGAEPAETVIRHHTDRALVEAVLADPFAIGIASGSETGNAVPLGLSGQCGFAVGAGRLNAKTEDYPLTAPIFLYLPARRLPRVARDFLAWTRSSAAQLVIRRAGFTDQAPEEIPIAVQGDRFANAIARAVGETDLAELKRMVAFLRPMQRLSLTFRFEAGSATLDAQSRSNIAQLAESLETGAFDGRRLAFVGFSDGDGPAEANRDIALRRAESVLRAVVASAETAGFERLTLQTEAFGEALPMACDDSAWGRQVNRRVEVWVR